MKFAFVTRNSRWVPVSQGRVFMWCLLAALMEPAKRQYGSDIKLRLNKREWSVVKRHLSVSICADINKPFGINFPVLKMIRSTNLVEHTLVSIVHSRLHVAFHTGFRCCPLENWLCHKSQRICTWEFFQTKGGYKPIPNHASHDDWCVYVITSLRELDMLNSYVLKYCP